MATFSFSAGSVFQDGTSVGAYPASLWPAHVTSPEGAPPGAATNSQTMSGGAATFTGLAENTRYYAGAQVSGTWRYVGFTVVQDIEPDQDNAKRSADETISGAWTFTNSGLVLPNPK